MSVTRIKLEPTVLPLVPHLISVFIDLVLWTLALTLSAGVLWTVFLEGTWQGYSWALGATLLFNVFLIVRRRVRRRKLITAGETERVEIMDYGEDTARFPRIKQALPGLETLVWVSLLMYVVIVPWSYGNIRAVDPMWKYVVAAAFFTILIMGRLGWMWAARGKKKR